MKVTAGEAPGEDLQSLFDALKHICDSLEHGGLSVEESVTTYAQGIALQARIKAELGKAERRVVEIIDMDGVIKPFDVEIDGSPGRGTR